MKLFLDTNVLIDFILERPAFYLPTAMIVSFAVEGKNRTRSLFNVCRYC